MNTKYKDFKLSDLPKHNVYQVPEDYFDRLPTHIMERTVAAPKEQWLPVQVWQNLRVIMAPLVLLMLFTGVFYFSMESGQHTQNMATVSDTEIVDYLTTYATLESADLAELNTLQQQELTADYINVSAAEAEEELEYYNLKDTEY